MFGGNLLVVTNQESTNWTNLPFNEIQSLTVFQRNFGVDVVNAFSKDIPNALRVKL